MKRRILHSLLVILIFNLFFVSFSVAEDSQHDQSLRRGESRQTLDPKMFSHPKVKMAYQAAKDIPWVLDSIYCFCFCEESPAFRHKSLLSCYVDLHASR